MGRNNQKRRAAKKRREDRSGGGSSRHGEGRWWGAGPSLRPAVEAGLLAGAQVASDRDEREVGRIAADLAGLPGAGGLVTPVAGELLARVLASLWEGGWQPAEVVRQVRRRRREAHTGLVVSAMSAARAGHGRAHARTGSLRPVKEGSRRLETRFIVDGSPQRKRDHVRQSTAVDARKARHTPRDHVRDAGTGSVAPRDGRFQGRGASGGDGGSQSNPTRPAGPRRVGGCDSHPVLP